MMDLVYWSEALRAEREHEAAHHQRASHARAVLRRPEAPLRRDTIRSLLPRTEQRCATLAVWRGIFGACA